ncbi:flagellar motor switch phosphatase FliY [Sporolactobacillus sp. Y61]|uniref:Flagellar motor switch phosphatase FliY n=1 Tax=Sporolactobacillus sp. Y61 TaxID=3160863 RepID=A0AAU8IDH1_9BACL
MSDGDGQLSQEEIDALIGKSQSASESEKHTDGRLHYSKKDDMSELEEDVLGEIGNISFGSAATALSTILNQKVEITTPEVRVVNRNNLANEFPVPHVSVLVNYTKGFQGSCLLVIKTSDASVIANLMMGGDGKNPGTRISDMEMSAVQEAMNQMMGSSSTAMSTVFNRRIDISPPELTLMDVKTKQGIEFIPKDEVMFEISFKLTIGNLVDSHIMQLVPVQFGKHLVSVLIDEDSKSETDQPVEQQSQSAHHPAAELQKTPDKEKVTDSSRQETNHAPSMKNESKESKHVIAHADVHPAAFSELDDNSKDAARNKPRNLNLLMDIPLDVSVELGRTQKTVKEVLELGPGSVIELDKLAGEAIDILVNQKHIARGEVVVVDENFGIRITEILDHYERIKNM